MSKMKQIVLNIRVGKKNTDIAFPCVEEELGKALASIGLVNTPSPKAYVTEVVEPDALCLLESKVVDLDEVNYLAKLMDSEDETEKNTLFAVTACEGYDTPKELINLHFNLGCYTLVQPTDDAEAVGRRYIYSMKPCMTMTEAANTDFEKIGKDFKECIDYETCGEIFADEVKGKFLNGGFAYISEGKSLEDILSDADMRMGGIQ